MKKITLPSKTITTCFGCKFHKKNLLKSGRNPIYVHNCDHKEIKHDHPIMRYHNPSLDRIENGYVITPDWCPLIQSNE